MVSGVSSVSTYKPIAGVKRKRADEEAVGQIERPYKRPKTDSNGWSTGQRRIVKARLKPLSTRPSGWQNNLPSPQAGKTKDTKLAGKITISVSNAKPQATKENIGFISQKRGERPETIHSDAAEKQTPLALKQTRVPLGEVSANAKPARPSATAAKSQFLTFKGKAASDSTLSKPQEKRPQIDTPKQFIAIYKEFKKRNDAGLLKDRGKEQFSKMTKRLPEMLKEGIFKGHKISDAEKKVLGTLLRTPTNLLKTLSTLHKKQSETVLSAEERKTLIKLKKDITTAAKDGALDGVPLKGKDKENIDIANQNLSKLLKTKDGDIKSPADLLKAFAKLAKKELATELSPKEQKLFNKVKNAILEALDTGSFNGKKLAPKDIKNLEKAKAYIEKKGGKKPTASKSKKPTPASGPQKSGPNEALAKLISEYKDVNEEIKNMGEVKSSEDKKAKLKSLNEELKEIGNAINILGIDPDTLD